MAQDNTSGNIRTFLNIPIGAFCERLNTDGSPSGVIYARRADGVGYRVDTGVDEAINENDQFLILPTPSWDR